jgi:hypothetical protein
MWFSKVVMIKRIITITLCILLLALVMACGITKDSVIRSTSETHICKSYEKYIHISPDKKRLAYWHWEGDHEKVYLILNDSTSEVYDDLDYSCEFSPDSAQVVYIAKQGDKWLVVIDGTEGNQYDRILYDVAQQYTTKGSINFDLPDVLNYLAEYQGNIYLVEETIE